MIAPPAPATLRKYGLTADEWLAILERQGGVCAVCKKVPSRPVTDHQHVPKWKQMKPEQRKLYVRGILCWFCNHWYLARAMTVAKAQAIVSYLQLYQLRS